VSARHAAVLLPGGVLPAAPAYAPLLEMLGERVDAVVKDLEVYADDEPPLGFGLDTEVVGIARAADAHGFDRFHLVGYSGGGAASLAFAARHGGRLQGWLCIYDKLEGFARPMRCSHRPSAARLPDQLFRLWQNARNDRIDTFTLGGRWTSMFVVKYNVSQRFAMSRGAGLGQLHNPYQLARAHRKVDRVAFARAADVVHRQDRVGGDAEGAGEVLDGIAVAQRVRADGEIGIFVLERRRTRDDGIHRLHRNANRRSSRRQHSTAIHRIEIADHVFVHVRDGRDVLQRHRPIELDPFRVDAVLRAEPETVARRIAGDDERGVERRDVSLRLFRNDVGDLPERRRTAVCDRAAGLCGAAKRNALRRVYRRAAADCAAGVDGISDVARRRCGMAQ